MLSKINHTQLNNDFIDVHMKELSGAETKVFIAISRKTIGWHKDTDKISLSQIMSITGLSNKGTIKAIQGLEEKKIIIVTRKKNENNRNFTNEYEINYEQNTVGSEQKSQGSEISSPTGSEISSHTKETIKETNTKDSFSDNELLQKVIKKFHEDYQTIYDIKLAFGSKEINQIKNIIIKSKKIDKEKYEYILKEKYDRLYELCSETKGGFWKLTPGILLSKFNEIT